MKKNKLILKYCPNFYKIKNYEYEEDDIITSKLISIYEDYIFNTDETLDESTKKITILDIILNKYISDYTFRKEIQNNIMNIRIRRGNDIINVIVDNLIQLFENYEEGYTRNIYFARWI